jgi:ribosome biogenesis GTPase
MLKPFTAGYTGCHMTFSNLTSLGWSEFYHNQLTSDDEGLFPMRIASVHRSRLTAETGNGQIQLELPLDANIADYAVGDWALVNTGTNVAERRLDRVTLLRRRTEQSRGSQLIAANVDTLFIVTSCNEDFNLARLERYLALANEAGTEPVIVLTKIDKCEASESYLAKALELQRDVQVVLVNAKNSNAADALLPWCGDGQTVALVGSSGVGKSTLLNTLANKSLDQAQLTGDVRKGDAKGRHTTTSRSLHSIKTGGWIIDTPGMRTLHVGDVANGLDILFSEITDLAPECRFRDCTHEHEPGCAVQAEVKAGRLSRDRLERWRKLDEENTANTPVQTGPRGNRITVARNKKR